MDWMYLVYFLLGSLLFIGAKPVGRDEWNEEYTSREQTKVLQGVMALCIMLHHMGQKTCASWQPSQYVVHGLDFFVPMGYLFVGVFFFCSGLGLIRSLRTKPDYLKGFCRRRILPLAITFYLSEIIYTVIRWLVGEKMENGQFLRYLTGWYMANFNAWYVVVIVFFYLVFWASFRFCKNEGIALSLVFLFTLAYTVLGAVVGHPKAGWPAGEWWYNSIILFPLGLLFGKFEEEVTAFFRRKYWLWLVAFFAAAILLFRWSEDAVSHTWGYYGLNGPSLRVRDSLLSAGTQWLAGIAFTGTCFLLMMKVRLGNRVLAWLGSLTLELYLMHGLFVEMFGFNFHDVARSVMYIRKVPLYMAAVLACSVPAAVLFRNFRLSVTGPLVRQGAPEGKKPARTVAAKIARWVLPLLFVGLIVSIIPMSREEARVVGGLKIKPPAGYELTFSDSRMAKWVYRGSDKKPGQIVLDEEIRGYNAEKFMTVEAVMEECFWLEDREIYVNPNGVRMVRGFCMDTSVYPERRYYVECSSHMFLLSMIEDSRYYDTQDCEEAMQQTADAIRR